MLFSEIVRCRVPKCSSADKLFKPKSIEQQDRWKAAIYSKKKLGKLKLKCCHNFNAMSVCVRMCVYVRMCVCVLQIYKTRK